MARRNIDRRDLLKLIGSSTAASALAGVFPERVRSQARAAGQQQEQHSPDSSRSAIERAPERLLQSEPVVSLNPAGEAKIEWDTVIPTQGGSIYVGVPNDEITLDWPIYNASQPIVEENARVKHEARIDLRAYATRSAPPMLLEGGTLAYRLELFDSRKGATQFIDRHFSFRVEHGQFHKAPTILEGPFLSQISGDSAIVWWVTDVPTTGEVRLSNGLSMPSERGMGERHVVRLHGLSANTKYRYQASSTGADGEIRSRNYTLRTAPQDAFSFVFTCDGR